MVNITQKTTRIIRHWPDPRVQAPYRPRHIAELRQTKRGTQYFCLYLSTASVYPRPVVELRMSVLKDSAVWICKLAEEHKMDPDWLESLLDYIYLELNRRLTKGETAHEPTGVR